MSSSDAEPVPSSSSASTASAASTSARAPSIYAGVGPGSVFVGGRF
jgi:hypothetical protein